MRASSVLFVCSLAALLFLTFAADDAYWKPTEQDLEHVKRAVISVPPKCEGGKYPGTRKFLGTYYLKYPEQNFQAVWLPGPPKLTFFSATGQTLRDISLVGYEAPHIKTVLASWGFHEDAKEALDYRTRNYVASSGNFKVAAAPELKRDESGKVLLPDWFVKRQEQIQKGEISPDDASGIPMATPTVDEDGNPWFIKTPFDPNAPLKIAENQLKDLDNVDITVEANAPASKEAVDEIENAVETIQLVKTLEPVKAPAKRSKPADSSNAKQSNSEPIVVEPLGPAPVKPIEVKLKPGERTIIYAPDAEIPAPHDEL